MRRVSDAMELKDRIQGEPKGHMKRHLGGGCFCKMNNPSLTGVWSPSQQACVR